MTSVKLSTLPTTTDLSLDDYIYLVDNTDPTHPVSRKTTVGALFTLFESQTMDVNTYSIGQTLVNLGNPDPTKWLECDGGSALRADWPLLSANVPGNYGKFDAWKTELHTGDWTFDFIKGRNMAINPTTGTIISANFASSISIARSTDQGYTWTQVVPGGAAITGTAGGCVCYGNNMFVLMTGTSLAVSWYSTDDGLTWQVANMPSKDTWNYVAWNGSIFVAVTTTSGVTSASSIDGINWIARTYATSATCADLGVVGTTFVITFTSGSNINYSTNGTSWTAVAVAAFPARRFYGSATWGFVGDTTANGLIYRTTDGINYTAVAAPYVSCSNGIINGTDAIIVAGSYRFGYTTDSGLTWNVKELTQLTSTLHYFFVWNGVIYDIQGTGLRSIEQLANIARFGLPYAGQTKWSRTYIKAA